MTRHDMEDLTAQFDQDTPGGLKAKTVINIAWQHDLQIILGSTVIQLQMQRVHLRVPHFADNVPPQEVFAWPGRHAIWTNNEHLGRTDAEVYRRARRQR